MTASLTSKQAAFVQEYLVDLNGTQAAIRAGYAKRTANRIAAENLTKPVIQEAIKNALEARNQRTTVSQDRVIEELARIAFGNLRDFSMWNSTGVTLKDSETLTEAQAASISEVSHISNKGGDTKRVKQHDKVKALELLMRHMGMLTEKVEHSGEVAAPTLNLILNQVKNVP